MKIDGDKILIGYADGAVEIVHVVSLTSLHYDKEIHILSKLGRVCELGPVKDLWLVDESYIIPIFKHAVLASLY